MDTIPREFFDISTLDTVSGAAVAVYLIVRFTKPVFRRFLPDWTVRLYTLSLSWMVLGFARVADNAFTARGLGLMILDGFVVAFAAMGLHEAVHDPGAHKIFIRRDS